MQALLRSVKPAWASLTDHLWAGMIHLKDQSQQLLEGAPTKSINIPPPEKVFLYKAQNAAQATHPEDPQVRNARQWEDCSGVVKRDTARISTHLTLGEDSKQFENRWLCQNFAVQEEFIALLTGA